MRQFLIGGAVVATLSSPAFAGSPTPPTPPNIAPVTIGSTQSISVTAGAQVSANIHVGPLELASSMVVRGTSLIGASLSVSNQGYTTP